MTDEKPITETTPTKPGRRYDVDWLRLMAVFLLFFFHTARVFDPWEGFYVQNNPPSPLLSALFIRSLGPWHMNLFFLLAGASTYFALRVRGSGGYVQERFKRLFIPFLFGVLVLIPPQSYLGLRSHSDYAGSFLEWFPNFFNLRFDDMDGYFLGGHTWGHLWFIMHLFVYSLVATPLFRYLNGESGRRLVDRLARAFTWPGVLFLFPVPLILLREFPEIAGGNPLFYIAFFVYGFLLMSDPRFGETIDRQRVLLLVAGPLAFAAILVVGSVTSWAPDLPGWVLVLVDVYADCFVPWLVILTLLAYGRRFLNCTNRFLKYFAEGAYPLYLLHQTVIVVVGYYVVQWDIPVAAKFTIIVLASFAICVLVYDLLVRRTNLTRFLFGMKTMIHDT